MGESEALSRQSQRDLDFGPWWWRLRCWLAEKVGTLACRLEPEDKSSTHWSDDGGETITFATVRRRIPPAPLVPVDEDGNHAYTWRDR